MNKNKPVIFLRASWFEGSLEEKFRLYGPVIRFPPDRAGRLIVRGYWSQNSPHYLLSASHDVKYVKPANVREDFNLLLAVVSRDQSLNQRVVDEFSARTKIVFTPLKREDEIIQAVSKREFETYLGLEREGLAFLGFS